MVYNNETEHEGAQCRTYEGDSEEKVLEALDYTQNPHYAVRVAYESRLFSGEPIFGQLEFTRTKVPGEKQIVEDFNGLMGQLEGMLGDDCERSSTFIGVKLIHDKGDPFFAPLCDVVTDIEASGKYGGIASMTVDKAA